MIPPELMDVHGALVGKRFAGEWSNYCHFAGTLAGVGVEILLEMSIEQAGLTFTWVHGPNGSKGLIVSNGETYGADDA